MQNISSEDFDSMTPMAKMINWIESGCSTSGEKWEDWKQVMLQSERISIIEAKTEQLIKNVNRFINDN